MRKLKVFLCHSSEDKALVKTLYKRLYIEDIDPWLDEENLLPGENWDLEIKKAVKLSDVVIICLSDQSVRKEGYIQKEIRYALDIAEEKPEGTIFIIPVKLNECTVPQGLSKYQWINYFAEDAYEKLLRSLRKRAEHLLESGQKLILPKTFAFPRDDFQFTRPPIDIKAQLRIDPIQQERLMYRTLRDFENYLDTGDLRKLTFTSIALFKDDILKTIKWLIEGRNSGYKYSSIRSIDGVLENLRLVRDSLQVAQSLFKQEYLDVASSKKFFIEIQMARNSLTKALNLFSSNW